MSDQTLKDHPKTKRAARALGLQVPHLMGHLHCLWHWALDYAQDGDLSEFDAWEIADAAMYEGDAEAFVSALAECGKDGPGFLEQDVDSLLIHDWEDYAGRLIAQREANAERMRVKRAEHVQRTCNARTGATVEDSTEEKSTEQKRTRKEDGGAALVTLALTELPASESTKEDFERTIARYQSKLTDEHIERIIVQLGNYRPPKPRPKLHLTLAAWLNKEPRDSLLPAHTEWQPPPAPDKTEPEGVPMPEEVQKLMGSIGKAMP